jgi:hypothetical protein
MFIKFWLENLKGRTSCKGKDNNNKVDVREIQWEIVDWNYLAQDGGGGGGSNGLL